MGRGRWGQSRPSDAAAGCRSTPWHPRAPLCSLKPDTYRSVSVVVTVRRQTKPTLQQKRGAHNPERERQRERERERQRQRQRQRQRERETETDTETETETSLVSLAFLVKTLKTRKNPEKPDKCDQ